MGKCWRFQVAKEYLYIDHSCVSCDCGQYGLELDCLNVSCIGMGQKSMYLSVRHVIPSVLRLWGKIDQIMGRPSWFLIPFGDRIIRTYLHLLTSR